VHINAQINDLAASCDDCSDPEYITQVVDMHSDLAASSDSCDDCSDPEFNPDALMGSCKDVGLTLPWMPHT